MHRGGCWLLQVPRISPDGFVCAELSCQNILLNEAEMVDAVEFLSALGTYLLLYFFQLPILLLFNSRYVRL